MLPGSTERILSVSGVADAIHIAVYYIGTILLEYQERNPGPPGGAYRQQPGGFQQGPPSNFSGPPPPRGGGGGGGGGGGAPPADMAAPGSQTQQIFIPNALVGASE
jgi:poly(rC)-binding protein 2/3/4